MTDQELHAAIQAQLKELNQSVRQNGVSLEALTKLVTQNQLASERGRERLHQDIAGVTRDIEAIKDEQVQQNRRLDRIEEARVADRPILRKAGMLLAVITIIGAGLLTEFGRKVGEWLIWTR